MSSSPVLSFTKSELSLFTVKQLKGFLRQRHLSISGNKDVLIQRLLDIGLPQVSTDGGSPKSQVLSPPPIAKASIAEKRELLAELQVDLEIQKTRDMIRDKTYNIQDNTNNDMTTLINNMSLNNLPRPEPPVFNGDPLTYPDWESAFNTLIDKRPIPEEEKVFYLRKYVSGKAKESIEGYLMINSAVAYQRARETLKSRYGNPFAVANAFRNKLSSWSSIATRDCEGLRRYGDFLVQCSVAKDTVSGLNILDDHLQLQQCSRRLPDWALSKWSSKAVEYKDSHGNYPDFDFFARFVSTEAEHANDPVFSLNVLKHTGKDSSVHCGNTLASNYTNANQADPSFSKPTMYRPISTTSVVHDYSCINCQSNSHPLFECHQLSKWNFQDRMDYVRKLGLCFGCFKRGHQVKMCTDRKTCSRCGAFHPTCFHRNYSDNNVNNAQASKPHMFKPTNDSENKAVVNKVSVGNSTNKSNTSMIVPVYLYNADNDKRVLTYALIDTQSDTSFIDKKLAISLGLSGVDTKLTISTITGTCNSVSVKKFSQVIIKGMNSHKELVIPEVYSRDSIPINSSHIPIPDNATQWPHLEPIAEKIAPLQSCSVGLLIGYNCSDAMAPRSVVTGGSNEPYAIETDLGWSIVGGHSEVNAVSIATTHRISTEERVLNSQSILKRLEEDFQDFEPSYPMSQDDQLFLRILNSKIELVDGHYSMPLPFRTRPSLPNNRRYAMSRLLKLRTRLEKDVVYSKLYSEFVCSMLQKGEAEIAPRCDASNVQWYIPHHGVIHPAKPGKLRVVFDASANFQGQSLNSHLLQGPDLINNLTGVLCRFRKEPVAVSCDIQGMFHQFKVDVLDRDYLRFLWFDCKGNIVDYRMTGHIFGATSSPGCANFGLKHVAQEFSAEFPKAAAFIQNDFYVDDGLISLSNRDEAMKLMTDTVELCSRRGLKLHKFVSNDQFITKSLKCTTLDPPKTKYTLPSSELSTEKSMSVSKALGIHWDTSGDFLGFAPITSNNPQTRRQALSLVASLYDPLGLAAPFIMKGKLLLQEMCKDKSSWDTPMLAGMADRWMYWTKELCTISIFNVPRCYKAGFDGCNPLIELHIFCDASTKGYGACSYLRYSDENNSSSTLVMAKSRVAPLRPITIPRLELQSAVTGAKVAHFLMKELQYTNLATFYWTDSMAVLGYINNDSRRFHTFVCNRVEKIRELSNPSSWKYIPSSLNPADMISRGSTVEEMNHSSWLCGPDITALNQKPPEVVPDPDLNDPEVRNHIVHLNFSSVDISMISRFARLSSWLSLVKAVANLRRVVKRFSQCSRHIDYVNESVESSNVIVSLVQWEAYPDEINALKQGLLVPKSSRLFKLDPYLDDAGLLRVGGRLQFSRYSYNVKHPCILPRNNLLTHLLVLHYHQKVAHQGRTATLNHIRSNGYHIVSGTTLVSSLINKCVICRKIRGKLATQKLSDLPSERCEEVPPFTYVGFDCFGPFHVRDGRKEHKRYGVVFSCLGSRSVHIEAVEDLSSDAFINALRCLLAIRGPVSRLYSDRGTNFIGANNEFKAALAEMSSEAVSQFLQDNQCQFVFNTPSSSHMGGSWERLIRTIRQVMNGLAAESPGRLDTSSLRTLFYEVMAIVNSRPISYIGNSDGNSQPEPLTPNHLLTMKVRQPIPPPGTFEKENLYGRRRWRKVQYLAEQFWSRWRHEYLSTLQKRQKWHTFQRNLKVGDVVLLMSETSCRSEWRMGLVVHVYPSRDGLIRKVSIRMGDKCIDSKGKRKSVTILDRPVHKCIVLFD